MAWTFLAALLTGCGAEDPDPKPKSPPVPPPILTGLIVTPAPAFIGLGEIAAFSAMGRYSDGSTGPVAVIWDSNPATIADPHSVPSPEPGKFFGLQVGVAAITAMAAADPAVTATVSLTVALQPAPQPTIVTTSLPHAYGGVPYQVTLQYANGSGAPAWSIDSGALPPGLSLDPATGMISGDVLISAATGNVFPIRIRVTDSAGTDTQDYELIAFEGTY